MVIASFIAALAAGGEPGSGGAPAAVPREAAHVAVAPTGTVQPAERTYRLPLALAYGVPFSFHLATWIVPSTGSAQYAGLSFVGMLAAPVIVHAAHGNAGGAVIGGLGSLTGLVGGAAAGALVLIASGKDVCGDCDDQIGEVGSQLIIGGLIGAGIGYPTWAVIDTVLHARVARPGAADAGRALSVAVVPSLTPLLRDGTHLGWDVSGASLSVSGLF